MGMRRATIVLERPKQRLGIRQIGWLRQIAGAIIIQVITLRNEHAARYATTVEIAVIGDDGAHKGAHPVAKL